MSPNQKNTAEGLSRSAWQHWRGGRIEEARTAAVAALDQDPSDPKARHLQILTSFVLGEFENCVKQYDRLDADYERCDQLTPVMIDAYVHLNRLGAAAELARKRKQPENIYRWLEQRRQMPLRVGLEGTTIIPFTDSDLPVDLMPAVSMEINGQTLTCHIDTGGAYIAMSPKMAKALGIEVKPLGPGLANMTRINVLRGIARKVEMGDAVMHHVPVGVLSFPEDNPAPPFMENLVVMGTNILERFFTTWDNIEHRLILSPRGDEKAIKEHLELLPRDQVSIDFYYLGDHHLGARGSVDDQQDTLFHVDTGLVTMDAEGRQPALAAAQRFLKKWEIPHTGGPFADRSILVCLGQLQDAGHIVYVAPLESLVWQELPTSAMLTHGFTKNFIWTMDFENRKWLFSRGR